MRMFILSISVKQICWIWQNVLVRVFLDIIGAFDAQKCSLER